MNLSLEDTYDGSEYYVNFTHVRGGENYHAYIRLKDIKSWESVAMASSADRSTRWRLTTVQGDEYFTLNTFSHIMETSRKFPRPGDGRGMGRVSDAHLYRENEYLEGKE